jgi:FMN reductase (NADPH)/FMN reductase [NAD(P)H]
MRLIHERRSIRAYQERSVERETANLIIQAAMRAPTAGNMMLYSIVEVAEQGIKDKLAASCDNQPFIATAPLVLLFLADYQRWFDYFIASGVEEFCDKEGRTLRYPGEGDLLLACCDALIAAQTAVIAAEALGLGSCYIGDIMEQFEFHQELFDLPQYTFPVALLCIGYPKESQLKRALTPRYPQESVHFVNEYNRLDPATLDEIIKPRYRSSYPGEAVNYGQAFYARKFAADFSIEMTRSVKKAIESWTAIGSRRQTDQT